MLSQLMLLVGAGELSDDMRFDVNVDVDQADVCQIESGITVSAA